MSAEHPHLLQNDLLDKGTGPSRTDLKVSDLLSGRVPPKDLRQTRWGPKAQKVFQETCVHWTIRARKGRYRDNFPRFQGRDPLQNRKTNPPSRIHHPPTHHG